MDSSQTPPLVRSFAASMPVAYRRAFDTVSVAQHAAIVQRRHGACRVEAWREAPGRMTAIAVVADQGAYLQAQLAATMAAHEMDVLAVRSYSRTAADGRREILSLQWIRPRPTTVRGPLNVELLGRTLDGFVCGRTSLENAIVVPRMGSNTATSRWVRFQRQDPQALALGTETADRPRLLLHVSEALASVEMQIVQSEAYASQGRVHDWLGLAELDGAKLAPARLLEAQAAVLAAVERTQRTDRGGPHAWNAATAQAPTQWAAVRHRRYDRGALTVVRGRA
jgi:UTP:GlnB (protein PII) uridylyltransferase